MRPVFWVLAAVIAVPAAFATSQGAGSCADPRVQEPDVFVACAREATAKYRDLGEAVLDGFRPIGDDFPSMGEHWIHAGRVFDGTLDPERPEVLSYARLGGEPVLIGVAYALPLLAGESSPDWPVPAPGWHDHYGSLDEETFLPLGHEPNADGPRIAMLHAWLWLENPAGLFAPDNWALPYLRLGLEPSAVSPRAARALSLVSGGDAFFRRIVEASPELGEEEGDRALSLLEGARASVARMLAGAGAGLSDADVARLEALWNEIASEAPALDVDAGHHSRAQND
jgi:hypothetical protein